MRIVLAGMFLLASPAYADGSVPGLPVAPVGQAVEVPVQDASSKPATGTQLAPEELLQSLQTLERDLRQQVPAAVTPPPSVINVKAGVNQAFAISASGLNRITVPFAEPEIKTVSETAGITVEGSVVYVSAGSADPVSMFVLEKGQPDLAISLTLMPAGIPQVDVRLELDGQAKVALPARRDQAEKWELSAPYAETLSELITDVASQRVPPGYGIASFDASHRRFEPTCTFSFGTRVRPAQILTGSNLVVVVAEVRNVAGYVIELDESQCARPGVLAVAAYPSLRLGPGEATELYIVSEVPTDAGVPARPVVIGGAP